MYEYIGTCAIFFFWYNGEPELEKDYITTNLETLVPAASAMNNCAIYF
jgi:hypothetical protein